MESGNDLRVDIRPVMRRWVGASSIRLCKTVGYRSGQKVKNFHAKVSGYWSQIGKNRSRKVAVRCIMWWAGVGILEDGFGFLRSLCNMAVMKEQGPLKRPRVRYWPGNNTPLSRYWKTIKVRDELKDAWSVEGGRWKSNGG
jgi:hypothetical protein